MGKRSERFFLTFVSRPVPFIYIPPTWNECGRKPIAMYVISGHFRRCTFQRLSHGVRMKKDIVAGKRFCAKQLRASASLSVGEEGGSLCVVRTLNKEALVEKLTLSASTAFLDFLCLL